MVLTSPSINSLFPYINISPSGIQARVCTWLAMSACSGVQSFLFFRINPFSDETPNRYYFSVDRAKIRFVKAEEESNLTQRVKKKKAKKH